MISSASWAFFEGFLLFLQEVGFFEVIGVEGKKFRRQMIEVSLLIMTYCAKVLLGIASINQVPGRLFRDRALLLLIGYSTDQMVSGFCYRGYEDKHKPMHQNVLADAVEKLTAEEVAYIWRPNQGHHSAAHDFVVEIRDTEHPITKGLAAKLPQPKDELYANLRWQPAGTYHLLATAYDDHSLYGGKARQPIPGPGLDQPMLWTLQYGQGRVFATVLGHDGPAVQTPTFVSTFARGAEWAAIGKVTIPIPPELAK